MIKLISPKVVIDPTRLILLNGIAEITMKLNISVIKAVKKGANNAAKVLTTANFPSLNSGYSLSKNRLRNCDEWQADAAIIIKGDRKPADDSKILP